MTIKGLLKPFRRGTARPHYEFVPEGWARGIVDPRVKGWNVASVPQAQERRLAQWRAGLAGTGPLGIGERKTATAAADLALHNTLVTFAYVAALAADGCDRMSLLDWGGGMGQYALAARAALPGVAVDYFCKEVAVQCESGRQIDPQATFFTSDDEFAGRTFDLVFASGALHYENDWVALLGRLAAATGRYLFVTRLPVVSESKSFVVLQRAYEHGYETEYLGWCLNRGEWLDAAARLGLEPVREFLVAESAHVARAPEQYRVRGFLFRPKSRAA
jgi:putative methyltransferase (TIGR04325 family)